MAPPIREPVRNPESAPRAVREAIAARRAQRRRNWVKGGVVAAAIAGAVAVPVGIAIHRDNPRTWENKNPAMVQAAQAQNFHEYDRQAFQTVPALRGSAPVVFKHWNAITNIADKGQPRYNTLAVVDTLSRIRPEELSDTRRISGWAGGPRMNRRSDVITRAMETPGGAAAVADLYKLRSSDIESGRSTLYGRDKAKNWQYGALRSGTHTIPMEYAIPKNDAPFNQIDIPSQSIKAKKLNR
jgi:hypothetical protein